jgi:flagellar biosynthesis/type III secretory pathway protein FliH
MFNNIKKKAYGSGYSAGFDSGFSDGSKKAIKEYKKVLIKTIQKEIAEVASLTDIEFLDGLNRAIDIVRKGK